MVTEIVEDGEDEDAYTEPDPHARTSWLIDLLVLLGFNLFLFGLVISILKFKDVEVG